MSAQFKAYRLLIVSPIPIFAEEGKQYSLDLWVEDLQANLEVTQTIGIIAPKARVMMNNSKALPADIRTHFHDELLNIAALRKVITEYDVIMIGAGAPAWRMRLALQSAKIAHQLKKCVITSVSSNRAQTTMMNAIGKGLLSHIKAKLVAASINATINKLAKISNGIQVVGAGVKESVPFKHHNIYVDTASWIQNKHILSEEAFQHKLSALHSPAKAIIATRLEPMKGVHLAINALSMIKDQSLRLSILGRGPSQPDLEGLVKDYGLQDQVSFDGMRTYPEAFFNEIQQFELLLLTNLNEEQPRLIFDAISQGLVPICPDSTAYRHLNLPEEVLYKRGDAKALANTWYSLSKPELLRKTLIKLRPLAFEYTIHSMHHKRAIWISQMLDGPY